MTGGSRSELLRKKLDDLPRSGLVDLLEELVATRERPAPSEIGPEYAAQLREVYSVFQKHYDFSSGQLIKWKPQHKNTRRPSYGEPVIVVAVLEQADYDVSEDAGSPYYRQPLNLIVGMIDSSEGFLLYHVDGRRFEPYDEAVDTKA